MGKEEWDSHLHTACILLIAMAVGMIFLYGIHEEVLSVPTFLLFLGTMITLSCGLIAGIVAIGLCGVVLKWWKGDWIPN